MKVRKIKFDVVAANHFYLPKGVLWETPINIVFEGYVELEFEWDEKDDVMKKAESLLRDYMTLQFPDEDYRIYYWWWDNLP